MGGGRAQRWLTHALLCAALLRGGIHASSVHTGHYTEHRPQKSFLHGGQNSMGVVFLNTIPAIASAFPDAVCNDGRCAPTRMQHGNPVYFVFYI